MDREVGKTEKFTREEVRELIGHEWHCESDFLNSAIKMTPKPSTKSSNRLQKKKVMTYKLGPEENRVLLLAMEPVKQSPRALVPRRKLGLHHTLIILPNPRRIPSEMGRLDRRSAREIWS